jgi:hypothetical protein
VDQDVEGCVTDKGIINQQRGILSKTFKVINYLNLGDVHRERTCPMHHLGIRWEAL